MFKRKKNLVQGRRVRADPPKRSVIKSGFTYNGKNISKNELRPTSRAVYTNNEPLKQKTPSKNRLKATLTFAVLGIILVLIEVYVSSNAKIVIIQPNGFKYQPHTVQQYQQAAAQALSSSVYNHLKLTINSTNIETQLQKIYPEIQYAAVTVPFIGSNPTVYIQLTKPELVYLDKGNDYLVNSKGQVIAESTQIPINSLNAFAVVESTSNSTLFDGTQVLTPTNVIFIQTIKTALTDKNVAINKMVLVSGAEELDVYIQNVPYYVKFNLHQTDALAQVGTYFAAIAALKQQGKTPTQYIDVRVDGRAYYI